MIKHMYNLLKFIIVHSNILVLRYLTRELICHLSQSSTRPSTYFSLIVITRSNPFHEPTSTKQ